MDKLYRPIGALRNWERNPRGIKAVDFERLKEQIKTFGQLRPLVITPDGEVLGGNMRLRAMQDLGIEEVWVSVVYPKNETGKLEYALSDNDSAGHNMPNRLVELIKAYPELPLSLFKVDMGRSISLEQLMERFGPDKGEATLDEGENNFGRDSYIKKFVITFEDQEFNETLARLQKVMQKLGMRNNTEVILELLSRHG